MKLTINKLILLGRYNLFPRYKKCVRKRVALREL
jgi:hypothetical protein